MRPAIFYTLVILSQCSWTTAAQGQLGPGPDQRVLPAGVPVFFQLLEDIDSRTYEVGNTIALQVRLDVKIGDDLLIRHGSYAEGVIKRVERARSFGRPGSLVIEATHVQTVDGKVIPISGRPLTRTGAPRKGAALIVPIAASASGLVASTPITLPLLGLSFLIKGKNVSIPMHSALRGVVRYNTPIDIR